MRMGCRAEAKTGMHWCVIHRALWPSGEVFCVYMDAENEARAMLRCAALHQESLDAVEVTTGARIELPRTDTAPTEEERQHDH